jgi:hypothetical protein
VLDPYHTNRQEVRHTNWPETKHSSLFRSETNKKIFTTLSQTEDISAFLPPGFKLETVTERTEPSNPSQEPPTPEPSATTPEPTEKFGVKFPTRPGGVQKVGLPDIEKHSPPATPAPVAPKIKSFSDM